MHLFSVTRVCNDEKNYFFSDFHNVYELVRGEFEYVQTFSSHRQAPACPRLRPRFYAAAAVVVVVQRL